MRVYCLLIAAAAAFAQPKVGEPAPPLTLAETIPGGVDTNWAALRGKPVVVEFWSTWCANCVEAIPRLNDLVKQFNGIHFLSISDEPRSTVEPFLAKQPIAGLVGIDRDGATFKRYGVEARPQAMLVDRDGLLRAILHPDELDAAALGDLAAGRAVQSHKLAAPLRMMEGARGDPVFALMLRPSQKAKGGMFALDAGKLEADGIELKTILAVAYSVGVRHIEGPEHLLKTRYDACVLLPDGMEGEFDQLREMLERSFRLKIRREGRPMDAVVLRLGGEKQARPGPIPMARIVGHLESQLDRMVVNETGLTGRYRAFEYPEKNEDLAAVLRKELGIEMAVERRSVEMLVIESMELPAYRRYFGR